MNLRVLALVAALAFAAGCGGDGNASASSPSPPPASAPASADAEYLAAIEKIDPALSEDPESAVTDAKNICLDVEQGKPAATVVKNAAARFEVGAGQAKAIVKAARKHVC